MRTKYLVQILTDDGNFSVILMSPHEIIRRIDMQDCSNEKIEVYDISKYGKVQKLVIYGTWHNFDDPLYIKVTTKRGKIVFDGHGEDH